MKRVFLASSIDQTARAIAKDIGQENLKLAFVKTGAEIDGENLDWMLSDRKGLVDAGFIVSDFTFTGKEQIEVKDTLKKFDVIHINGGNTFYLLEQIQKSNSKEILIELINSGKIYTGSSAGSILAGPDIYPARLDDDMSEAPSLKDYKGLALVDFVALPHWGSEHFRVVYENKSIEHTYNMDHKLILLTDRQYIKVIDDFYKIVEI